MAYKQSLLRKHKLINTEKKTRYKVSGGVWYSDVKDRYIKYNVTNKWLKDYSTRVTRRRLNRLSEINTSKSNDYRKYYDYWWALI